MGDAGLHHQGGAAFIGHGRHDILEGIHIDGHEFAIHAERQAAAAPVLDLHKLVDRGAGMGRDLPGAGDKAAGVQRTGHLHGAGHLHFGVITDNAAHAGRAGLTALYRVEDQRRRRGHIQLYSRRHRQRPERLTVPRVLPFRVHHVIGAGIIALIVGHHQRDLAGQAVGDSAVLLLRHISAVMPRHIFGQLIALSQNNGFAVDILAGGGHQHGVLPIDKLLLCRPVLHQEIRLPFACLHEDRLDGRSIGMKRY